MGDESDSTYRPRDHNLCLFDLLGVPLDKSLGQCSSKLHLNDGHLFLIPGTVSHLCVPGTPLKVSLRYKGPSNEMYFT